MCFLIPSFFTSIFVISVAILPAIGTALAVGLAVFTLIIILKALFSSKKTEASQPFLITYGNKTYQLSDEEFDMTKNVENKKELEQEEPIVKVPTYKDEFKIVYFVIAAIVFLVVILFANTDTKPKRIYSEHEAIATKEDVKPEIKEVIKEISPVIETKPVPDPTDNNYIKVCNNGQLEGQGVCPKSPVLGSNPTDWACTKDKKTGLIWEVKTTDGDLRDKDWRYNWYEPDSKKNGAFEGYAYGDESLGSKGVCSKKYGACNTFSFAKAVNKEGLCGAKDWRMPTRDELIGLLNCFAGKTIPNTDNELNRMCSDGSLNNAPNINKIYFPNTLAHFWSSTSSVYNGSPPYDGKNAWLVVFSYGGSNLDNKAFDSSVRLVRKSNVFSKVTKNCTFENFERKEKSENSQYTGVTGIKKDVSKFMVLNKSYFFDVPSTECKTNEFLIKNDTVQAISIYGEYIHVNYENPKNGYKKLGWIKADSLKQIERKYKNYNFKITGGVGAMAGGIKHYDVTCSNNESFSIIYDPFNDTYEINSDEDSSIDFKSQSLDETAERICEKNNT